MIDPIASNNSLSKGDASSPAHDPGKEAGTENSKAAEHKRRPKKNAA